MKSQEILYHTGGYTVIFRPAHSASDAGNNIDIREDATGMCQNIQAFVNDDLGRCTEDLYTAVQVADGLLYATTFRGLRLTIELKQQRVIDKKVSK